MVEVAEPPIDKDLANLNPEFRVRLEKMLARLAAAGHPFRVAEGHRTVQRQVWLYASGRTRKGSKLTDKNGTTNRSNHQGGNAADCYPIGIKVIPPHADPIWGVLAEAAEAEGLFSGHRWGWDSPHVELK